MQLARGTTWPGDVLESSDAPTTPLYIGGSGAVMILSIFRVRNFNLQIFTHISDFNLFAVFSFCAAGGAGGRVRQTPTCLGMGSGRDRKSGAPAAAAWDEMTCRNRRITPLYFNWFNEESRRTKLKSTFYLITQGRIISTSP